MPRCTKRDTEDGRGCIKDAGHHGRCRIREDAAAAYASRPTPKKPPPRKTRREAQRPKPATPADNPEAARAQRVHDWKIFGGQVEALGRAGDRLGVGVQVVIVPAASNGA